jgi:hypothetical protein
MTRAAAGALVVAAMLGGAGPAAARAMAADDAAILDAEGIVNTENGVHAAPSGHVAAAPLPSPAPTSAPPAAVRRPVAARPVAVKAPAPPVVKTAAAPIVKTAAAPVAKTAVAPVVKTAAAPAVKTPAAPVVKTAAVAPAPPAATPRAHPAHVVIELAREAERPSRHAPARLVLASSEPHAVPPHRAAAMAARAPAPATPELRPAPRRAPATRPPGRLTIHPDADEIGTVLAVQAEIAAADPAPPPLAAAIPAEADDPAPAVAEASPAPTDAAPAQLAQADQAPDADGPSEEASVYRRTVTPSNTEPSNAEDDQDSDQPQPVQRDAGLQMAHDERDDSSDGSGRHVAFPRRSAEAAAAFDRYMHAVSAIDAGFKSGAGVAQALRTASAYDPHQLEEGVVAYGAMAALQSPRFVYGVADAASDPDERRSLIEALLTDPESAADLPGAREAAALAGSAILREARPVMANGQALKQASYDVQHQDWSIAKAYDQPGRLAGAKAASSVRVAASEVDMRRLVSQIAAAGGEPESDARISPVTEHSLALAALTILGADADGRLEPVVEEASSAQCLKLAKLNLFQCLSVAGPEYEDVYCLAQHAVIDTGKCVAGAASPVDELMASSRNPRMSRRGDYR